MQIEGKELPFKYDIQPSTEFSSSKQSNTIDDENVIGYEKDADYYFDSYSHFGIHEDMLKDKIRTMAYMNAITKNKHLFHNKIVLDVGSGTGILSIFAAKSGAKHVYAVENASIANHSQQIIKDNKLADKITVIKGKIEEIKLPVEKVDIIISEWMGYFLLYESMLDSVLFARDKYLAKDGQLFPDRAIIYMATIEDEEYMQDKFSFWENVYGVDMSCIKKWAQREPLVELIEKKRINGDAEAVLDIDLQTVKIEDLEFANKFNIKINRNDYINGYVTWFEVYFSYSHIPVRLSTSPFYRDTHWKQTIFYIDSTLPVNKGDTVSGTIQVKKNQKNPRYIDIKISTHVHSSLTNYDGVKYFTLN